MSEPILEVRDLKVSITDKPEVHIIKGIDLMIRPGEVHTIMGPNGSGKSTLSSTIAGSPAYTVDSGQIFYRGEEITEASADERARKGIFLSFQYPTAIPGVTMVNFMREALKARRGAEVPAREFLGELRETLTKLKMGEEFARRYVNDGFSGGEKKRLEMLQMALLKPEMAILDETDSGLDIDALRIVAEGVNTMLSPDLGVLVITHYQRLLDYLKPQFVHVLARGRIVTSGGPELAHRLEREGYAPILAESGLQATADEAAAPPIAPAGA